MVSLKTSKRKGSGTPFRRCFDLLDQNRVWSRWFNQSMISIFASLVIAGIAVQIYTDIEQAEGGNNNNNLLTVRLKIVMEILDLLLLLSEEMVRYFEYNDGPYDIFLQHSLQAMQDLDQKLLWMNVWLTEEDLQTIPSNLRVNITSPAVLKQAIRNIRDLRRNPNGTSEFVILNFYSVIIDQLGLAVRDMTVSSPRFPGWQDFLSLSPTVQTILNAKLYEVAVRKLANENRQVNITDMMFLSLFSAQMRFQEMILVAMNYGDYAELKMNNLTDQESYKEVIKRMAQVNDRRFNTIDPEKWTDIMQKYETDLGYILSALKTRVDSALQEYSRSISTEQVFSAVMVGVSIFLAVIVGVLHVLSAHRLQGQISKYGTIQKEIDKITPVIYDFIPKSYIEDLQRNMTVHHYTDAVVFVGDIYNLHQLMLDINTDVLTDILEAFYVLLEAAVAKFNCFKQEVTGESFIFASQIGEYHAVQAELEMILMALNLLDAVTDMNTFTNEANMLGIRVGISAGSGYACISHLQLPRITLVGEVVSSATLMHATSHFGRVQISEKVYKKVKDLGVAELQFVHRGTIQFKEDDPKLNTYWVMWSDSSAADGDDKSEMSF